MSLSKRTFIKHFTRQSTELRMRVEYKAIWANWCYRGQRGSYSNLCRYGKEPH